MSEKRKRKNDEGDGGGLLSQLRDYERRRKQRSTAILLFGVAGCALFSVVMIIIGFIISAVESSMVVDAYGEEIAGLCRTLPMGEADIANAPAADGPSRLLLLRTGAQARHAWHNEMPVDWRAETADEVTLVGCVEIDDVEIEQCEYSRPDSEGGTFTVRIEREQTTATVVLLNPTSGERVAERAVTGSEPEPCPPDSEDLDTMQRLEGSVPTSHEFAAFLETFVDAE
ncbi:MAG: hypothetical protein AAF787_21570 [Chloroflexota bacterium]